ncbi:kinase-like domain-containing protein [Rhizophagus irregularis DAOM 181602=DAOM 197198]|nr:kinase-like domain-containing protein [Rhizophagus irregularis DAOM 181602=DAOM 197198]
MHDPELSQCSSNSNNKSDTDNKWIQWIKDGIANEYINYHDYNEFQDMECIGVGGFDSGTLKDYLKNNFNKLGWNVKLQFAIQIADVVACMHQKNIVHCDLNTNNILAHQNKIKLINFGLSRRDGRSRNKKSDVYSVGILLWEISTGRQPFESYNNIHDETALILLILNGKRETSNFDTLL